MHRGRIRLSPEREGFYPHFGMNILFGKSGVLCGHFGLLGMTPRFEPSQDSAEGMGGVRILRRLQIEFIIVIT